MPLSRRLRALAAACAAGAVLLAAPAVACASGVPAAGCGPTRIAEAAPFGSGACTGVRPGARLYVDTNYCSWSFLFKGSDGARYATTAGHCILGESVLGERRWPAGKGPVVKDDAQRAVGRAVYAISGEQADFAVVRLDRGVKSSPEMCHFGGPTRLTTRVSGDEVLLTHFGQGVGAYSTTPARTSYGFFGLYRPDYIYAYGAVSIGDSGAGITTQSGEAVGVITDLSTPFTGNFQINRYAPHLARVRSLLKLRLTLLTAPLR